MTQPSTSKQDLATFPITQSTTASVTSTSPPKTTSTEQTTKLPSQRPNPTLPSTRTTTTTHTSASTAKSTEPTTTVQSTKKSQPSTATVTSSQAFHSAFLSDVRGNHAIFDPIQSNTPTGRKLLTFQHVQEKHRLEALSTFTSTSTPPTPSTKTTSDTTIAEEPTTGSQSYLNETTLGSEMNDTRDLNAEFERTGDFTVNTLSTLIHESIPSRAWKTKVGHYGVQVAPFAEAFAFDGHWQQVFLKSGRPSRTSRQYLKNSA